MVQIDVCFFYTTYSTQAREHASVTMRASEAAAAAAAAGQRAWTCTSRAKQYNARACTGSKKVLMKLHCKSDPARP